MSELSTPQPAQESLSAKESNTNSPNPNRLIMFYGIATPIDFPMLENASRGDDLSSITNLDTIPQTLVWGSSIMTPERYDPRRERMMAHGIAAQLRKLEVDELRMKKDLPKESAESFLEEVAPEKAKLVIGGFSLGWTEAMGAMEAALKSPKYRDIVLRNLDRMMFVDIAGAGDRKGIKGPSEMLKRIKDLQRSVGNIPAAAKDPLEEVGFESLYLFPNKELEEMGLTQRLTTIYQDRSNFHKQESPSAEVIPFVPDETYLQLISVEDKQKLSKVDAYIKQTLSALEGKDTNGSIYTEKKKLLSRLLKVRSKVVRPYSEQVYSGRLEITSENGVVMKPQDEEKTLVTKESLRTKMITNARLFGVAALGIAHQLNVARKAAFGGSIQTLEHLVSLGLPMENIIAGIGTFDNFVKDEDYNTSLLSQVKKYEIERSNHSALTVAAKHEQLRTILERLAVHN